MQKHHVHTTISSKHQEILKRQVDKHGSYQKVIELALESLENSPQPRTPELSVEERFLLRWAIVDRSAVTLQKVGFQWFVENLDMERVEDYLKDNKQKEYLAYMIEYFYLKPYKECSLKEILDLQVILNKVSNMTDSCHYSDDGDHYMLKIYHSLGPNGSKILQANYESLFMVWGAKVESTITDRTVFMKIHKDG